MDASQRRQALQLAKGIIVSHGMMNYMNKYNKDQLSRQPDDGTTGLRYEYHLDPTITSWSACNPTCTLSITYAVSPAGARVDEAGDTVVDNTLRISVSASATDMDVSMLQRREGMISSLGMLCELLQATLPPVVQVRLETATETAARKNAEKEQQVAFRIVDHIGEPALKGLVSGGRPRVVTLDSSYADKYPEPGRYRFKRIISTDRRGRPRETRYYVLNVFERPNDVGRIVMIQRIKGQ